MAYFKRAEFWHRTSTNVDTHTYLFPTTVRKRATLPFDDPGSFRSSNMAPYADLDLGIDPDVVNTSNQREFVEGLTSIPTLSIVMDADHLFDESEGLYFSKGPRTRPASVELIYPSTFSGFEGFEVDCGIEPHSTMLPHSRERQTELKNPLDSELGRCTGYRTCSPSCAKTQPF